jgi:hypothetical protein
MDNREQSMTEVPEGILNEIKMCYGNVVVDLDSDVTEDTISRKLHYKEISTEVETVPVMDPLTFELHDKTGYPTKCYMTRLDITEGGCIVRRIMSVGSVLTPELIK